MTGNHEDSQESDQDRPKPKSDLQKSYRMLVVLSTPIAYGFFYWGWSHLFREGEWEPVNTWLFALGATVTYFLAADLVRRELGGERSLVPYVIVFGILGVCVWAIFAYDIRFQQPAWGALESTRAIFEHQIEFPTGKNIRNAVGFMMINGLAGGAFGVLMAISAARTLLWWKGS